MCLSAAWAKKPKWRNKRLKIVCELIKPALNLKNELRQGKPKTTTYSICKWVETSLGFFKRSSEVSRRLFVARCGLRYLKVFDSTYIYFFLSREFILKLNRASTREKRYIRRRSRTINDFERKSTSWRLRASIVQPSCDPTNQRSSDEQQSAFAMWFSPAPTYIRLSRSASSRVYTFELLRRETIVALVRIKFYFFTCAKLVRWNQVFFLHFLCRVWIYLSTRRRVLWFVKSPPVRYQFDVLMTSDKLQIGKVFVIKKAEKNIKRKISCVRRIFEKIRESHKKKCESL